MYRKKRKQLFLLIVIVLVALYICDKLPNNDILAANCYNYVFGDINEDGTVNMKDIVLLQQYMNSWEVEIDSNIADVNHDMVVNMKDIVMLQQYMNNIIDLPSYESDPTVEYKAYVQDSGWMECVCNGETVGVPGEKSLEAIIINLEGVEYRAYISNVGWEDWKSSGEIAGISGGDNKIEAIQVKFSDYDSAKYDICYRIYAEKYGWLEWAKNGESSSSIGIGLNTEAVQIKLVEKEQTTDLDNVTCLTKPLLTYTVHVQDLKWQSTVNDNEIVGTIGQSLRMEALRLFLNDFEGNNGIQYKAHVSDIGWQDWMSSGEVAGTVGKEKPIEAVRIKLSSSLEPYFDIYYRVYVENAGWLGWAKNGENAGSTGMSLRVEAIQIQLLNKTETIDSIKDAYLTKPSLTYTAHVQDLSWQNKVNDGEVVGTTGEALRLEALKIYLKDFAGNNGIQYRAHVSDIGWQDWVSSGEVAGTEGKEKPIEAIRIKLSSSFEAFFDIYYRVHTEGYGWLGWAKNGENSGTIGGRKQVEAVQIKLVNKSSDAPGGGTPFYELEENIAGNDFVYPMLNMYVCGNDWRSYYSARPSRPYHVGIDIASGDGNTNIYSTAKGTVEKCGWNSANGNYVVIKHTISGKIIYSFYAHLSSYCVSEGTTVDSNTIIGVMGNTGSGSAGAHLHFAFVDTLANGNYYGYVPYFTGDKTTYEGVTFYNPHYIVQQNQLP